MADLLELVNSLDTAWHAQSRTFEREAVTRFWGLLTLPARALDRDRPAELLSAATAIRNARFVGSSVQSMFFQDQAFTEVDAILFDVGSPVGHPLGRDVWVIEVERKTKHHHGDYFRALHRAEAFCQLLQRQFGVEPRPVVIFEDDAGKLNYPAFHQSVLVVPMSKLRAQTAGLSFRSCAEIPGAASDRTMVKLGLLKALSSINPHAPGSTNSPLRLARLSESQGWPLRLPVVGHQDIDSAPRNHRAWLELAAEDDGHLAARVSKYVSEMEAAGLVEPHHPLPRLSMAGSDVALSILRTTESA